MSPAQILKKLPVSPLFHSLSLTEAESWLVQTIYSVLHTPLPQIQAPIFTFEMTPEAAEQNFHLLDHYKFDLGLAISKQAYSPVSYSSKSLPW